MGFDVTRSVAETFGSRTTVLDRILSYMYFADLSVVEQSTSDEYGSGVSFLGLKGSGDPDDAVMLASPLPTARFLSRDPSEAFRDGGHEMDLSRYVDLMARTWAVSEMAEDDLRRTVLLLGYRPDPVSLVPRRLVEDGWCRTGTAILYSPSGKTPSGCMCGQVECRIHLSGPGSKPAGPVSDLVAVRVPGWPPAVWRQLNDLAAAGIAEPLDVLAATGSDGFSPSFSDVVLGLYRGRSELPGDWIVQDRATTSVRIGTWTSSMVAAAAAVDRVEEIAAGMWSDAGMEPPEPAFRVLALDGCAREYVLTCVVFVPPATASSEVSPGERIEAGISNYEFPVPRFTARAEIVDASFPEAADAGEGAACVDGPGASARLVGIVPDCRFKGPDPARLVESPEDTARELGVEYLSIIRSCVLRE